MCHSATHTTSLCRVHPHLAHIKTSCPYPITSNCPTGWPRPTGCLIFIGHVAPKSPIIRVSFAENDVQLKALYGSSPPCMWCYIYVVLVCVVCLCCVCVDSGMCLTHMAYVPQCNTHNESVSRAHSSHKSRCHVPQKSH